MNKLVFSFVVIPLLLLSAACAPAPILPAAPIPTLPPLPSLVPPATLTQPPTLAPATPTVSGATATLIAAVITSTTGTRPAATVTATLTVTRPTVQPSPTSAAAGAPPGVYVTDLKVEPNPPSRSADLTFSPTFVNSMATPQNYQWKVYIYKTDTPSRSTGETAPAQTSIPVGTTDQKPGSTWKYGPGNQCEFFFLQVGFRDQDGKIVFFAKPDGKVFQKNLSLCP